ncbi:MAG: methyl-accepting chemotaxis protein [Halothiobacillaceae bacterium]|nr:MAG: methyl-accepting chemotaxis protein [Halothiobacillaceae bacterium]
MKFLMGWFLSMSIRWKLQFAFFMVTMVTIVINRVVGYGELKLVTDIVRARVTNPELMAELEQQLTHYIVASFWQSGIEFVVLFGIIAVLANFFVAPIKALCRALDGIERGDLTHTVPNNSRDEIGILERNFNSMLKNLTDLIRGIEENGKQMSNSSFQIASISHEIAAGGEEEKKRSDEVASATEELRNVTESIKALAEQAAQRAVNTDERAQQGMAIIRGNINEMNDAVSQVSTASQQVSALSESAQKIYNIIGTIRTIAEQTNLLALNAAIEAARAGEQGRGFAVVADEVRNLATRTKTSTGEISGIINSVTQHTPVRRARVLPLTSLNIWPTR